MGNICILCTFVHFRANNSAFVENIFNINCQNMFRFFDEMMKNIEKLPGNNFKKGAELEIVKMKCMAEEMKENRSSEIFRKFR